MKTYRARVEGWKIKIRNGSRLGEVVDFEKLSLKFIDGALLTLKRITNEQFRTTSAILPNRCYWQCF